MAVWSVFEDAVTTSMWGKSAGSGGVTAKTTDGAGKYLFTNVSPGLLRVKFTAPSGHNFTKAGGGDPERDSNADSGGYSGSFTISGAAGNTSMSLSRSRWPHCFMASK